MTDPIASAALSAPPPEATASAASANATQAQQTTVRPSHFEPGETRMFANMMQGTQVPAGTSAPSAIGDAAKSLAAQLSGNVRSMEDMRKSMLESIDFADPIKTMFVMTDHAMEANMMFARMHISTGLASAATSLFGSLLKNQQ